MKNNKSKKDLGCGSHSRACLPTEPEAVSSNTTLPKKKKEEEEEEKRVRTQPRFKPWLCHTLHDTPPALAKQLTPPVSVLHL
jgi:hypothetical protein